MHLRCFALGDLHESSVALGDKSVGEIYEICLDNEELD